MGIYIVVVASAPEEVVITTGADDVIITVAVEVVIKVPIAHKNYMI